MAAGPFYTRISTSIVAELTVLRVGTFVIYSALEDGDAHTVRTHLKAGGTDTRLAIQGEDQAPRTVAQTLVADQDEAQLGLAADAYSLGV